MKGVQRWLVATLVACLLLARADAAQTAVVNRYKAVFLYHFIGYVTWPETNTPTFRIAVLGDTGVTPLLRKIASSKLAGDRPITVTVYDDPRTLGPCELLFVTHELVGSFDNISRTLMASHTLTVTDAMTAPSMAIQFVVIDDRVKFAIDLPTLERAGLRASSQLLKLAVDTGPRPGGEGM